MPEPPDKRLPLRLEHRSWESRSESGPPASSLAHPVRVLGLVETGFGFMAAEEGGGPQSQEGSEDSYETAEKLNTRTPRN